MDIPMLSRQSVRVIDVSRVAWLRQRLGRAASSLKVVGVVSGVAMALDGTRYLDGRMAFALAVAIVAVAFPIGKRLKAGSTLAARVVTIWLAVYGGWVIFASAKSLSQAVDFFTLLGVTIFYLPIYFLVRGLLALRAYRRTVLNSPAAPDFLSLNPWEDGSHGSIRRPKFLNKRSLTAYIFVVAAPLVWLFVAASGINRPPEVVANSANLAGRRMADVVIGLIVWLLMTYLYRRGRRHALVAANELLQKDKRDVVLYLRSFSDDRSIKVRARPTDGRIFLERFMKISFEELVTDHLWRYGPVVAIGDPRSKDKLVPLGAARNFEAEATWQQKATDLMRQASIIVAVAGKAEGFLWEMDAILRMRLTSRLVIVLPPVKRRELSARWRALTQRALGQYLPADLDLRRARAVLVRDHAAVLITADKRNDWSYETVLDKAAQMTITPSRS